MTAGVIPQYRQRGVQVSRTSGWLVVAMAGSALLGWFLGIPILKSGLTGLVPMNPATAVTFLLAGTALLLLYQGDLSPARRDAVRACGIAVLVLPLLCLSRLFLRWDLGPDQLLFPSRIAVPVAGFANRMAPMTGVNFVLLGATLLLLTSRAQSCCRAAAALATTAGLIGLAVIVDYGYQAPTMSSIGGLIPVALNTAIAFCFLATGLLCVRPENGVAALLMNDRVSGVLARRLLPSAILLPLLIGWLEIRGEYRGWFDGAAGDAIVAIATTLVLAAMIWQSAVAIDRADAARTLAQQELHDLNQHLESRVRERTLELERVNAGMNAEMTARRHAEEQLRRTTDELRGLFEASPLAICGLTPDDVVLSWNAAAEALFGWTAAEVIGTKLPIVSAAHRDEGRDLTCQALGGTAVTNFETQRLDRRGRAIDVSISTAALYDASGKARGIVAVYADMRDRKQLESQLRQSQKMEAVGRLAGGVAHDFNNILLVIQAAAEFMLEDLAADDKSRSDALEILNAAQRAAKLTRQLLVFSRQQVLELQVVDLGLVIQPLEPMLRRLLEANIDLSIRNAPKLDCIRADPGQLEQVMMNLVVNARDAMPNGGAILIETANVILDQEFPRGHLTARSGPHVMLSVTDTGIGMDGETQSRIFEPFFTTKPAGEGTGLGLATVYGIVKQLGGHLWVYSEPGRGATFKVYFPSLDGAELASLVAAKAPPPAVTRGARILLVEDDAAVRQAVRALLERNHYQVVDVASGDEALARMERAPGAVDLVLSDMMMPSLTGLELRQRLRELGASFPIVLMSGYSEGAIKRLGSPEELAPHIEKPFTGDRLVAKIEEALRA